MIVVFILLNQFLLKLKVLIIHGTLFLLTGLETLPRNHVNQAFLP